MPHKTITNCSEGGLPSLPQQRVPLGTRLITSPPLTSTLESGYTPTILEGQTEEVVLSWRIHRLREEPKGIGLVALGYGIAFAFWRLAYPYPLGLFLPVFALTGAISEYLFPIDYKLTSKGVYAHCGPAIKLALTWEEIRRARHGKDGIYLSPLKLASRLDHFRGIRLHYSADNRDEILATVRRLWKGEEEPAS